MATQQHSKFNESSLLALSKSPPDGGKKGYWVLADESVRGLQAWVYGSGRVTFYARGRLGAGHEAGKQVRVKLGTWGPGFKIPAARKSAADSLGRIARGDDPNQKNRERRKEPTIGDVWDHYRENHLEARGKDRKGTRRSLWRCHLANEWGRRRLSAVTEQRAYDWYMKLGRVSPSQANHARRLLQRLFRWAKKKQTFGYQGAVPMDDWESSDLYPSKSRIKDFKRPELGRLIKAAIKWNDRATGDLVLLAALTGIRQEAICSMSVDDIDFHKGVWSILPDPNSKVKDLIEVALSDTALRVIRRRVMDDDQKWVFPAKRSGAGHMKNPYKRWRALFNIAKLPDHVFHDLRGLYITEARSGKADPTVARYNVGHSISGTRDIQDRHYFSIRYEACKEVADIVELAILKAAGNEASVL